MKLNSKKRLDVTSIGKPHVVLLGAGASKAALPNGDKHGRVVPLMQEIVSTVGLKDLLEEYGVDSTDSDFEGVFSSIAESSEHEELKNILELKIFDYFSSLELPDEPTIYDYLVLSLREKDVIATFNWDPFLQQALNRNFGAAPLPKHIFYLHGGVNIGYCLDCKKTKGLRGGNCDNCGSKYQSAKLLYPVKRKDYQREPVDMEWAALQHYLQHAYIFTIFGYSAPVTDVEAIKLLKGAWGEVDQRELEEVEIIHKRGKERESVVGPWEKFIHTHHYQTAGSYFESILGQHPRQSCESIWDATMMCKFLPQNKPPQGVSLTELQDWFKSNHKL